MLAFAECDRFLCSQIVSHYLGEQVTTTSRLGREALANDIAQDVGETNAQLLLLTKCEHTENTTDRLAGVDRVQRAENEVASLCGHQSDFDGSAVAHFAHENDFRCLPQCRSQTIRIIA